MSKNSIVASVTTAFHKGLFQLKKHSPEILVVAGVVGTVISGVMACKATTKLNAVVEKGKADIKDAHEDIKIAEKENDVELLQESKKELAVAYARTGFELVKLYAPSVTLGALSITSILTSNNILRKRNIALSSAYAILDRGFKEYRSRVVERWGEETDRELRYNIKKEEVEVTKVDEETGEVTTVKETVEVIDPNFGSQYARFFDDTNDYWEKNPEYNLMFLRSEQNYANDILRTRGHLFLNEVYERLGLRKTQAGQIVGWIYDPNNPNHKGNNYVDFGIYDIKRKDARKFVNGYEPSILLDFNVDGDIWNLMKTKEYANKFDIV